MIERSQKPAQRLARTQTTRDTSAHAGRVDERTDERSAHARLARRSVERVQGSHRAHLAAAIARHVEGAKLVCTREAKLVRLEEDELLRTLDSAALRDGRELVSASASAVRVQVDDA